MSYTLNWQLTLYHKSELLTTFRKNPFENIVGKKGENAGNQHFLLFPQCFLTFKSKFQFFSYIYFVVCKCFEFGPVICKDLTLYSIDTHFKASTTDSFWKHCGKRRNCSSRAISSFPTMFSTQSENCISICQFFWHPIFICCWNGRAQNWHMR